MSPFSTLDNEFFETEKHPLVISPCRQGLCASEDDVPANLGTTPVMGSVQRRIRRINPYLAGTRQTLKSFASSPKVRELGAGIDGRSKKRGLRCR